MIRGSRKYNSVVLYRKQSKKNNAFRFQCHRKKLIIKIFFILLFTLIVASRKRIVSKKIYTIDHIRRFQYDRVISVQRSPPICRHFVRNRATSIKTRVLFLSENNILVMVIWMYDKKYEVWLHNMMINRPNYDGQRFLYNRTV